MSGLVRASLAGLLGLSLALPSSAATTSTFQVSATITAGCLVVGGVTQYGVLDYGTRSALSSAAVSTSLGGSTVTFQCTPGVALSMRLDGGQNSVAGSRNLKRSGGAQLLAYQLFRDAALTQSLGIGTDVALSYSDPTAIKLPVYGRAQLTGRVPAGTYTDSVQVTVTW